MSEGSIPPQETTFSSTGLAINDDNSISKYEGENIPPNNESDLSVYTAEELQDMAVDLKNEVGTAATSGSIISVCGRIENHQAHRLDSPAAVFIENERQLGKSIEDIKHEAEANINIRQLTQRIIDYCEMDQKEESKVYDVEVKEIVTQRLSAGESLKDILDKSRLNLEGYKQIDTKKNELARIEKWIYERGHNSPSPKSPDGTSDGSGFLNMAEKPPRTSFVDPEVNASLTPEIINQFSAYLYAGGQLIKEGKYKQAMEHFKNGQEMQKVGRRLSGAASVLIDKDVLPEDYGKLSDMMAKFSGYKDGGSVQLSDISNYLIDSSGIPIKGNIPTELEHEISLVYMEEWIHVLQDISGPLAGVEDTEQDVALLMNRLSIPMTNIFLRRYGRKEALEKHKEKVMG